MLEWLGIIIVDNVFGYILDQSTVGEYLHERLSRQPEKEAFQYSLEKTFKYFETQYPHLAEQKLLDKVFKNVNALVFYRNFFFVKNNMTQKVSLLSGQIHFMTSN